MTESIPCPYCGELMTPPIKFCVGCGRGVSPDDVKNTGLKVGKSKGNGGGRFALAKKEYSMHRKMRNTFWSCAAVMGLILGYYCVMKYGLGEEPWLKWEGMVARLMAGKPMQDPGPAVGDASAMTATTADPSVAAAPVPKPHAPAKTHRRAVRKGSSKT
jgi:hypothetical protein